MPTTKSAEKALRQSKRKQKINLRRKTAVVSVVKEIKKLVASGQKEQAQALISKAYKAIDKSAKSYLHKRSAARRKSRLMALVNREK